MVDGVTLISNVDYKDLILKEKELEVKIFEFYQRYLEKNKEQENNE